MPEWLGYDLINHPAAHGLIVTKLDQKLEVRKHIATCADPANSDPTGVCHLGIQVVDVRCITPRERREVPLKPLAIQAIIPATSFGTQEPGIGILSPRPLAASANPELSVQ